VAAIVLALALAGTAQAQPRMRDGTLTPASSRPPAEIARDFVGAKGLGTPSVTTAAGITSVTWRPAVDGVPASDRSLRVNLDARGRVLNVLGAPARPPALATTPAVSAAEALRAVQDDVGVHRPVVRRGGGARHVDIGAHTTARLVTYAERLAWRVRYRAAADAIYDATVDARTGDVLRRVNMVKSEAPALVWERYPGFGSAAAVDLEARGYLPPGATRLAGPYAHAFSDVDDDDVASPSEEVTRGPSGFSFPLAPAAAPGCGDTSLCSWTGSGATWQANREQDTVQAFYFANRFRDHLATLGFDGFSGADRVLVHTLDGAATGPDSDHVNNANMFTPPEGESPIMQMYLWRAPFRTVSSGSDAAVLYHEYTHGLSNRLVVDADGIGALNTAQAGAMGEGWSDWYAQDFLVSQFPDLDTGAAGEVDMGAYVDASSRLRTSPIDCPVGASPVACPGRGEAGSGGYTYGDFGRILGSAEVHFDGEIWAQALWDLRTALGGEKTRALVTAGMRLLAPEPSFLDARNGILLADQALYAGADTGAIWEVFARRGMGYFAASLGGEDTAPAEDLSLPPGPDAPRGTVSGRVTSAPGGAPVAGATIDLGGVGDLTATTDADGRFTLTGVPAGTYRKASAGGAGWDVVARELAVPGSGTVAFNPVLRRNWSAASGGAVVTDSNGREFTSYGCGPAAALDQSRGTAWSTLAEGEKHLTVRLPEAVDITEFGLDPAEGCGDTAAAATAAYMIETSPDGSAWTTAVNGVFTAAQRHRLNLVKPAAGASGVRFVRLSLLSSQGFGASYRDLSEFGVYGVEAGTDTTAPETLLEPGGPPFVFASDEPGTFECRLDAGDWAPCTSPHAVSVPDGTHTFAVRAVDAAGNRDETPATRSFRVDTTAPTTVIASGPPDTVHSGPIAFGVGADEDATFECALDDGAYGSCAVTYRAEDLSLGEHVFRARATDRAGNVDPTPAERVFTVVNTAPQAALTVDRETGPAPHTVTFLVAASDADGEPVSPELDFGDGRSASGTGAIAHRYDAPGTYTARLTVRDARTSATSERTVTVTTAAPAPGLSLQLSATALALGPFVPGVTRVYAAALTATTTGDGTLTVADRGASPGYLVSGTTRLARPLEVRAAGGAFAPVTGPVPIPATVEFRQRVEAGDVLRAGTYAKQLTFTLAPRTP
jgi:PKD repeat protein